MSAAPVVCGGDEEKDAIAVALGIHHRADDGPLSLQSRLAGLRLGLDSPDSAQKHHGADDGLLLLLTGIDLRNSGVQVL